MNIFSQNNSMGAEDADNIDEDEGKLLMQKGLNCDVYQIVCYKITNYIFENDNLFVFVRNSISRKKDLNLHATYVITRIFHALRVRAYF